MLNQNYINIEIIKKIKAGIAWRPSPVYPHTTALGLRTGTGTGTGLPPSCHRLPSRALPRIPGNTGAIRNFGPAHPPH